MPLRDDRANARDGYSEALDAAASGVDPSFADAYVALWQAAARREALSTADRELIGLAVNAAVTHVNPPAVRLHIDRALDAGATTQEIVEVLELVSVLGIHTLVAALPIVLEELGWQESGPLSSEHETLKQAFLDLRGGPWAQAWNPLLRADSSYFEAYTRFLRSSMGIGSSSVTEVPGAGLRRHRHIDYSPVVARPPFPCAQSHWLRRDARRAA
jgi:alkylhydroperoxidase/carboxymuconolactone decarboxylase family protein YurZ